MHPTRLRSGEIVAGLGAVALAVSLFLPWFETDGVAQHSGWSSVGWLALVPLVLTGAAGLGLAVTTMTARTAAVPLAFGVFAVPLSLLALLAILVRLIAEPGLGVDAADADVAVRWPAYTGLAGAIAVLCGSWIALADERTETAESRAQTERALAVRGAPRPVPRPRDPS